MSFPGCLVIEGAEEWQIIVGDEIERLSIDAEITELPVCAKLMTGLAKLDNPTVVLAPAATSCFFCLLKPQEIADARDRQAMLFELENHLPIDAESTVADFVTLPTTGQPAPVSSVAIDAARWQAIVDVFEDADLQVRSIVPASVLATRAMCKKIGLGETAELYLADGERLDLIEIKNETILLWKHLALEATAIRRHKALNQTVINRTIVVGLKATEFAALTGLRKAEFVEEDRRALVSYGAELLLENPSSRWFELRRGALAPSDPLRAIGKQLRWVGVAAAACLLAISVGGWWRSRRIENEIENVRAAQVDLFQQAFPNARMPGAVLRRVRSEHSKVLSSRGENTDIEIPRSAPQILRRVLVAIPADIRYRVTRIEILDGKVDLLLQVRNTVDAGKIATSISAAGFQVDPPGTRQVDPQTFESNLTAVWIGKSDNSTEAAG